MIISPYAHSVEIPKVSVVPLNDELGVDVEDSGVADIAVVHIGSWYDRCNNVSVEVGEVTPMYVP